MRRVVAAALLLVVLGACKVDVSVGVDTKADGSGEVRVTAVLDEDAAERVGDLEKNLRTDDLEKAGWIVDDIERRDDGSVSQTIRHPFDDTAEAEQVLAELGGDDPETNAAAPLRAFELDQERGFFRTTTTFSGVVDLARGIEAFSDASLTEAFGGQPLGAPVDQLERQLGASFDRLFGLQIAVRMPGDVESNAPTDADNGAVWAPKLGERVELTAEATRINTRNVLLLLVAVASTLALIAVLVTRRLRRSGPADED